jgi:hypothetical protein
MASARVVFSCDSDITLAHTYDLEDLKKCFIRDLIDFDDKNITFAG